MKFLLSSVLINPVNSSIAFFLGIDLSSHLALITPDDRL
jgi:hypothetical protein